MLPPMNVVNGLQTHPIGQPHPGWAIRLRSLSGLRNHYQWKGA